MQKVSLPCFQTSGTDSPCTPLALFHARVLTCRMRALLTGLALCFAATQYATAQAPPILNSPYVCANGLTYTVLVCKPFGADQWCQWREDQNGNTVTTANSAWTAMTGRLKGCTNAATKSASSPAGAQRSFDPPYMKEFPTPEQVMAKLKGSSPQDTTNLQLGAFRQFKKMIEDLAGSRWFHNQLTPDERRIYGDYDVAYNNLAKPLNYPFDGYFGMRNFVLTLFNTFPMPTVQPQWMAANAKVSAQANAQLQAMGAAPAAPTQSAVRPLPPTNDPTALAMRRCVELGGSMLHCIGSGMGVGMQSMMGVNTAALTNPGVAGVILFGTYQTASGLTFSFSDNSVNIGGCGAMVQGVHNYTLQPSVGRIAINISNQPQPLLMTLTADNKLTGPAAQDITGQKITGYWVTTNLRTGASTREPNFGPITVHCNIGTLQPGAPQSPSQGFMTDLGGALTASAAAVGMVPQSAVPQVMTLPPGPRVVGTFTNAGGLKIQFDDSGVIIDCARAHVKAAYDVSMAGGAVKITVKNTGSPITLTPGSNGTLVGSGSTTVNGKLFTGMNESTPVLEPISASCPVNSLLAVK